MTSFSKTILFGFIIVFKSFYSDAQSFYSVDEDGDLGIMDMSNNCKFNYLSTLDTSLNDIAFHPNGTLYGHRNIGRICTVDKNTGKTTYLATLPTGGYNSLICDNKGVLYAAGSRLSTYDTNTGITTLKGKFPNNILSGGDLTFRKGKLYLASDPANVVEVNINDPINSKILFSGPPDFYMNGIVTFPYDCDSTITYCTGIFSTTQIKHIGLVDFENKKVTLLCEIPNYIIGAATINEFISSDCSLSLDLDVDNNSGALGKAYKTTLCATAQGKIADVDVKISSQKVLDSVVVRLVSGVLDIGKEGLLIPNPSSDLNIQISNDQQSIKLYSKPSSLNIHFEAALQKIRYQNSSIVPSAGARIVQVTSFANKLQSRDTTQATIQVGTTNSAGKDTSVAVCADAKAFALTPTAKAAKNGVWYPSSTKQGFFDPSLDKAGVFSYVVTNTYCANDTAKFNINISPLPKATIVGDSSFCKGSMTTLKVSPSFAKYLWSDKSTTSTLKVTQGNLYTVTVTDSNGCTTTVIKTITISDGTAFNLGNPQDIDEGDSILLKPIGLSPTLVSAALWKPDSWISPNNKSLEISVKPPQTTLYYLKIKNIYGCDSEDSILINVKKRSKGIFVPTAFSPDGNGINDYFSIYAGSWVKQVQTFRIFDRWGELVFEQANIEPNEPSQGWNGTFRGREAAADVYIYYAVLLLNDGKTEIVKGDFVLKR